MIWRIETARESVAAQTAAGVVMDAFVRSGEKDFGLALSGGRVAPTFFGELIRQARFRGLDLGRADFFWADERCVPPDHPESNFRVAKPLLLEPLGVRPERVHRLEGEFAPGVGRARAEEDWEGWCAGRRLRGRREALDCVVLGVGEDGHVASLFPGNMEEDGVVRGAVLAVRGPKPPPERLTYAYRIFRDATLVVVLATGAGKAEVVRASMEGIRDTPLGRVLKSRSMRLSENGLGGVWRGARAGMEGALAGDGGVGPLDGTVVITVG